MVHFSQRLNSCLDLKRRKMGRWALWKSSQLTTILSCYNGITTMECVVVLLDLEMHYHLRQRPKFQSRFQAFWKPKCPSLRYDLYLLKPFLFLLHPLFRSLSIVYLHNINSHGSHHTCIANTMFHYNLIRRNQLVYAKMLARSIRLTRPLTVTGLPIKILMFLCIDNRFKWVDGTLLSANYWRNCWC